MPEGPEIRRAGDRISRALVNKEIVESNFYYERIKNIIINWQWGFTTVNHGYLSNGSQIICLVKKYY